MVCLISANSHALETVELQLRWYHQFQFAGYYAAIEKGFYQEAGLNVIVVPGAPNKKPVVQVLNGQANYGVGNSEVLLNRLQGKPLVALAAVFQHSPSILLTKKSSHITTPHDLVNKKVMMIDNQIDADFIAMFHNENIDVSTIDLIPSSFNIQDLANDYVDAFNAYITNEPYYLQQLGIEYTIIKPQNYGVDFYSDVLFTTENELQNHPERVEAFRSASMKGWQYAFEHKDEIIKLIQTKYQVQKSADFLKYEAEAINKLVLPNVVELGHMNPWRWQHMADTFIDAGMAENDNFLTGFNYLELQAQDQLEAIKLGKIATIVSVLAILILIPLALALKKMKLEISLRQKAENELKKLAYTDTLTGLANRHQFYTLAEQAIKNSIRTKLLAGFCFIDIDGFKQFNDTYGHHFGDHMLIALANILKTSIRQSDIAARIGGDEFVLIFENLNQREEAEQLIAKIKGEIEKQRAFEGTYFTINVSIGLGIYPEDARSLDELLKISDQGMYIDKRTKSN